MKNEFLEYLGVACKTQVRNGPKWSLSKSIFQNSSADQQVTDI